MIKNDRLERGKKNIQKMLPGGDQAILEGLGATAPDLANYVLEFIFGDLYDRPGLDIKTKHIITLTCLATLGNAKPQLAHNIKAALNLGMSRQEILDIFTHITGYTGFPASLNAVATAREVFSELDSN